MFLWTLSYLSPLTEGNQEHSDLSSALAQIRSVITAVDLTVSKYERCQELQEVLARLENKSFAKLKNGKVFRKQDLDCQHRNLEHKGLVYWKTATGRLKGIHEIMYTTIFLGVWDSQSECIFTLLFSDTLALLLTDVLVFLQEKDQRFIFAAVVSLKPNYALIPLVRLTSPFNHSLWVLSILSGPEASSNPAAEADC